MQPWLCNRALCACMEAIKRVERSCGRFLWRKYDATRLRLSYCVKGRKQKCQGPEACLCCECHHYSPDYSPPRITGQLRMGATCCIPHHNLAFFGNFLSS